MGDNMIIINNDSMNEKLDLNNIDKKLKTNTNNYITTRIQE